MDGFRESFHIPTRDSGHADPSVLREVDMMFLSHPLTLFRGQTCVAEHSDLFRDVIPIQMTPRGLQVGFQCRPHLKDPSTHRSDLLLPHPVQTRVLTDFCDDPRTVEGWIGVLGASEDLQLTLHCGRDLGIPTHDTRQSHPLTVETEILREALTQHDGMTVLHELSDRATVMLEITAREPLVRVVEQDQGLLLLDQGTQILPLLRGQVCDARMHE